MAKCLIHRSQLSLDVLDVSKFGCGSITVKIGDELFNESMCIVCDVIFTMIMLVIDVLTYRLPFRLCSRTF